MNATGTDQDLITQLQNTLMGLSQMMFTGIGVLQRDANLISVNPNIPVTEWTPEEVKERNISNHEFINGISNDITQTSVEIEKLIDSIPRVSSNEDKQIEVLEEESDKAGEKLEAIISEAEKLLDDVRSSLRYIMETSNKQ
ncbi:hypothetical protein H8356DRAFT_1689913 [Neocallimastix lanati (nom. inval.)]|jgi:ElaB/YqjD/DUF883 family membrane-anchored ribosome-binding protein|uniref:Mediator of RNA polymerase II transcription subunit 21 n=1 Tax=Neocallimastix californiae TaxID=1754190 RepID=A0A1Y2AHC6_9FUNG|nr:hypothetical protein H8356DRAFT_1689913 [Neocallimastix sp. JGI-2020a]ORY21916.1 hypothetical protein LY90DRAFT_676048 [Neocallimastix californiae]|eukprot:ORY21916.1 hypothetical protein LY90DRAFT_676048 [Neocallimastix californiae]